MDIEYFKNKFDHNFYVNKYEDIRNAGICSLKNCWKHVNIHGWKENRTIFADENINKEFIDFKNGIIKQEIVTHNKYETDKINVLCIFGNIDTSNASSIQIHSLLKHTFSKIKLSYYKVHDKIKMNTMNEFDNSRQLILSYDNNKEVLNNIEIKTITEVEEKLNNQYFNIIFAWSNPYITSNIAIALGQKYKIPVVLRMGDFYISDYSKAKLNDYRLAASINVPNDILAEKVIKFYGEPYSQNVHVISQHYDVPRIENLDKSISNDKMLMLHAGNMYQERKIDFFINTMKTMNTDNITLKFIGCHDKLSEDIELCKSSSIEADFSKCYQFEDWSFSKSIPFEQMRNEFMLADILVHIEYVTESNHFLSFKLVDYLSYGKPIITITQKNSPNYFLAKKCGIAFGDIEDENQLKNTIHDILHNPNKYLPNDNKLEYHVNNVSKQWEEQWIKFSTKKNFEFIDLIDVNKYDHEKLQVWKHSLIKNSYYGTEWREPGDLYTLWVMTTPFSESLIYTMQNLNYLGYKYKIILNDYQVSAFNYMNSNCNTKYWFTIDDDFIMMENSIEYMIEKKQHIKEPVAIFRLYDLNYGYNVKSKLNSLVRYGIKLHETETCSKYTYNTSNNTDLFYKEVTYHNYEDWKYENEKIVGYHELFCSNYDIFLLFLKMSYKFRIYYQDRYIVFDFIKSLTNSSHKFKKMIIYLIETFNLNISATHIDNFIKKFDTNFKMEYKYWFDNTDDHIDIDIALKQIIDKDDKNIYKLLGFIYGLIHEYEYSIESNNLLKTKYNEIYIHIQTLFLRKSIDNILIVNDVNKFDASCHDLPNSYKIYSITPLVTENLKFDIRLLINFPSYNDLFTYATNNKIELKELII